MNALFLALTFTAVVVLDYFWDSVAHRLSDDKRTFRLKRTVGIILLVSGWFQVILQYHKEVASDRDITFLKQQLSLANTSLTNAMEAVRGMSDGGTTWAVPSLGVSDETNCMTLYLSPQGEFPLRSVSVNVINETKRIEAGISHATTIPPSEPVYQRFIGDIPRGGFSLGPRICDIKLDPAITNHYRFEINAMNGFSWEIVNIWKVTNGWQTELHYRFRRLAGQLGTVEPSRWKNAILVY
jgi:hypothetical protein